MLDPNTLLKIQNLQQGYIHHWLYTEHNHPVMVVARYEWNRKKTYRQFSYQDREWIEGAAQAPYPLFGLDSLAHDSPLKSVLICEGEKCASLLHQLQWPGLSTALGASNTSHSDLSPLRHFKKFIILRDNDNPGTVYARDLSLSIRKLRPDSLIHICNLLPDVAGGDLIDWVQKYPLCGHQWDGYTRLSPEHLSRVSEALQAAINERSILLEDCKDIGFKQELALFDSEPQPISMKLRPVPEFPIDLLPETVRTHISFAARQMSIPLDFPATAFLALIGGILGRSVRLTMRPGQGWEEVANVWTIMVGPPAAKKSPILRRICKPLTLLEEIAREEFTQEIKTHKNKKKIAEAADQDFDDPEPILRRYVSDDCSLPKLRELLASNPRGLILRSDELKGQFEKFERDGNEGDRSALMQCWSGLELYNEDRVIRGSCIQIPLTITWIGCIQPACLSQYLRQAMSEGKGADGFMQRFQMVTFPDFNTPFEICKESPPPDLDKTIEDLFIAIDQMARDEKRMLFFSPEAQAHFDALQIDLETQCRSKDHPTYWESHLGKQPKLLASLCLILHVLEEMLLQKREDTISVETIRAAERIMHYYLEQAQRCYESIESVEVADARKILELIQRKKLPQRFKQADIYRNHLGNIRESGRVSNALNFLKDLGWVTMEKIYGPIGKASEYWVAHPKVLEKA